MKRIGTIIGAMFRSRKRAAALLAVAAALAWPTAADARGHNFFALSLALPIYAGPPAYYAPYPYYPPAYYGPVYYAPAPVAPQAPTCRQGLWRQDDGSVVRGVACLAADGYWRLAN